MGRPRTVAVAACALAWLLPALSSPADAGEFRLSPRVLRQIESLRAEKDGRNRAQRKLSSRLLHAVRARRGAPAVPGVPGLRSGVTVWSDGTTLVDLRGTVSRRLLRRIEELGGGVVRSSRRQRAVRARVPVEALETLAELSEVHGIGPAAMAYTKALDVSEGDVAHRVDELRASSGVDGSGVTVGVLSDGVDSLAPLQATGDLPPVVTVLAGQAGSGSEGTAMLEIIHDLAPGSELLFATAFDGQASFAANILALRAAGADVIVDDVGYFAEAVFQDDDIAAAVDTVTADGALYLSAAGNGGNQNDGTSGVWEGDFTFSGTNVNGGPTLDFGGGEWANEVTIDSPFLFTLHWSDPLGGSGNDYDLLLVSGDGSQLIAASTNIQNGNDDPYEAISSFFYDDLGTRLVVMQYAGEDRFLHVNANRGRLDRSTEGHTSGHSAARGSLSVAAVDVRDAGSGGVFDGSESVETYSSDGPRRVFFEADGTPITPGDFSSTGGELRQKPDLAAADCVSTATPRFGIFCGTSAAAPHAAGIAAVLLSVSPNLTPQDVRDALSTTPLDIEEVGTDRDSGVGIAVAADAGSLVETLPEPSATALLVSGVLGLAVLARRRPRSRP